MPNASDQAKRVVAVLQARMTSTRLPGKVLADVAGKPMIVRQIERIRMTRMLDHFVVATSTDASDDALARVVEAEGVPVIRGSLDDVLDRYKVAAQATKALHVVRLTGDCPLVDPDVVDVVIGHHLVSRSDITTNALEPTFPDGLDVEVVRADVLLMAAQEAQRKYEREHVTPFIYERPQRFRVVHYRAPVDLSGLRWTVDEQEDLVFVREVFQALYPANPRFRMPHVLRLLAERPELSEINTRFTRNAGLARSIAAEEATRQQPEDLK